MTILLADDERPLLNFLERGLRAEGYECSTLSELHEVLPYISKNTPEIVVLDRLFGSEDSLTIVEAIKALPSPPMILILTALDDVSEQVNGLQKGADDYLCKPFDFDELLARIAALRRRADKSAPSPRNTLGIGSLELAMDERTARINGTEISLTKLEFELLVYLTENQKKVLSRERILSRDWQTKSELQTNIFDVYISRLRRKLEDQPKITIQTLRGNGYRLSLLNQA
ncbi:response regulator transcription factor [Paraglaciecola psychrophila]|uniref:Winged helix family two component transcriptional regulator protein n=1 Tax=Paraglaciecola psychrophila 170 TaxID=1129794 RepID=K6ZRB8_9ALTE|nr:response regulator transcription factor [Paraglaciecola psychrophila]AGH43402.1 winged helix family two component transcriptional regulator protein [Paraglaciecola psychrophila 170]GAC38491.1 response regulator ArlR [Paraglaciecola psychrophila 170]